MPRLKLAQLFLRLGLITVFMYAAVASLVSPNDWVGYLPHFATAVVPPFLLLKLFSIYEILLSLWLLWGKYLKLAAALSALAMLGIVVSDAKLFAITFRDIAIATGAIALAFLAE